MKKISLLLGTSIWSYVMFAQSITPQVIASTGAFAANANGSLSYTVGEMTMVETFSAGGSFLTQGFQQPNEKITGLIDLTQSEFGSFVVYPNPVVDNLYYGFQFPGPGKASATLYNDIGQKITDVYEAHYETGKIVGQTKVSNLAGGMYLLVLTFTSDAGGKPHILTQKVQVIN